MRYSWDRRLDFDATRRKLGDALVSERQKVGEDPLVLRRLFYITVLLVQLINGCRVSEAFQGVEEWVATKSRETTVTVRKQRKDPDERLVSIPPECLDEDLPDLYDALNWGASLGATKMFAIDKMGFNTHSLRYAEISELSDRGVPLQVIAKLTHHRNVNFLVDYTNQRIADAKLRELSAEGRPKPPAEGST